MTADNAFGLNLFQNLTAGGSGNVAIAPISIAMALQIVYNGSGGATQQGMSQTLQLGSMSMMDLNNDNAALQGSLLNPDPQVQLTIANSLWIHPEINSVSAAFTQMDQTYYGATVGDLAGAPANVNDWVSTETDGLITDILPPGNYQSVVAVIANAIYFKGQWSSAFDPSQTAASALHLGRRYAGVGADDASVGKLRIFSRREFSVVAHALWPGSLQHVDRAAGRGNQLRRLHRGADGRCAEELGRSAANRFRQRGAARFTTTYGASLVQPLTSLGMQAAFCPNGSFPGSAWFVSGMWSIKRWSRLMKRAPSRRERPPLPSNPLQFRCRCSRFRWIIPSCMPSAMIRPESCCSSARCWNPS